MYRTFSHNVYTRPRVNRRPSMSRYMIESLYLKEAKADIQKLIDHVGEKTAADFLTYKDGFVGAEKDLYYWIKRDPEELEDRLAEIIQQRSDKKEWRKTQRAEERAIIDAGAEVIAENDYMIVYDVQTFEASNLLGRQTKWCITGTNADSKGHTGKYWFDRYKNDGIDLYFFIPKKGKGNQRYAAAVCGDLMQLFNELDETVDSIPNAPEEVFEDYDIIKQREVYRNDDYIVYEVISPYYMQGSGELHSRHSEELSRGFQPDRYDGIMIINPDHSTESLDEWASESEENQALYDEYFAQL